MMEKVGLAEKERERICCEIKIGKMYPYRKLQKGSLWLKHLQHVVTMKLKY